MRGLASVLLVLTIALALFSLSGAYLKNKEKTLESSTYSLELEREYYSKLNFKHAVLQAIAEGAKSGLTWEDKAENASLKLAEIGAYLKKTRNAEVWCGVISDEELKILSQRISREKKPLKCPSCWSAADKQVVIEEFPEKKARSVQKCLSFIDVDVMEGTVLVSKGGIAYTNDPEVIALQFSGNFVLGVSYYDELTGIGSIAIIPEGTVVSYK
jgi:hypothetical protein